jgi:hypothetical protein
MKNWRPFRLTIICIAAMLVIGLTAPMAMADDNEKIVFTVDVTEDLNKFVPGPPIVLRIDTLQP